MRENQVRGAATQSAVRKVLLVEDEVLVAALAIDALEELGYQTVEATTAKVARERKFTIAPSMIRAMVSQRMPMKRRMHSPRCPAGPGLLI